MTVSLGFPSLKLHSGSMRDFYSYKIFSVGNQELNLS